MRINLNEYLRRMNESELSGLLHKVVEELNRKKAKRQNVDVGFWDSEGNYKEDIQPIDEHDESLEAKKMYKLKIIDVVTYSIIMDKLEQLSKNLYDERLDTVNASYELDAIIEEIQMNTFDNEDKQ